MASFVTGQEVEILSADCVSCIPSRVLEDDAMVNFRMTGGVVGRLWTSSIAIGRQHGLTLQVFGETGGLRWAQEQPNQLYYMPLNQRLQIIERGEANLSPEADRSSRVTVGHAEGMPLAFGNVLPDLAEAIRAKKEGREMDPAANLYPRATDGLRSMAAVLADGAIRAKRMANGSTPAHQCTAKLFPEASCAIPHGTETTTVHALYPGASAKATTRSTDASIIFATGW